MNAVCNKRWGALQLPFENKKLKINFKAVKLRAFS